MSRHLTTIRQAGTCLALTAAMTAAFSTGGAAAQETPDAEPAPTEDVIFVHVCERDAPTGWTVIEEASALNERFVQCNYRVDVAAFAVGRPPLPTPDPALPPPPTAIPPAVTGGFDVFDPNAAGVAISVDYYCTAAEANEVFGGRTTPGRDTETSRSEDRVVAEEGPAAAKEAGRDRGRIVSSYFPNTDFSLQQKTWVRFNAQTLATIVINTNDRVVGVDNGVEAAARVVAANHLPAAVPGCEIAPVVPVAGVTTGTTATAGTGGDPTAPVGGGGGGRIGIVLGTGAVVTVGGVVVWRRAKNKPRVMPRANPGHVPPQCAGQQQAYEHVRERLVTLNEAYEDMNEALRRAERIHHINKLRASMIVALEAASTLDAIPDASRLRPSARRSFRAQGDTWRPPVNLDPRLARVIERASAAVEAASAKAASLRAQLARLRAEVANVGELPQVKAARDRAAALEAALHRAGTGLQGSTAARNAIDALDDKIAKVSAATVANLERMPGLESYLERNQGWAAEAADNLVKLTETVDGSPGAARLGPVDPRVARKQADLTRIQADVKKAADELAGARLNAQDADRNLQQLVVQRDAHMRDLANHGDVLERDVERLRASHAAAAEAATAAHVNTAVDLDRQAKAAQAALAAAEMEESLATTFRRNVTLQVDLHNSTPPPGLGRRTLEGVAWVVSLPFVPVEWLLEKTVGSVQSVPEAVEIVIRGERRIAELTLELTMIERAVKSQRSEAVRRRELLDQCVKQWSGAA